MLAGAAAVAGVVVGVVAGPGGGVAAYADDSSTPPVVTQLTSAQLAAVLTTAQATTATADQAGWSTHQTVAQGAWHETVDNVYAVSEGRASVSITAPGPQYSQIEVLHRGIYNSVAWQKDQQGAEAVTKALTAVNRPHAKWIYLANPHVNPQSGPYSMLSMSGDAPQEELGSILDPSHPLIDTPTQTVAADGTTVYDITEKAADSGTYQFTLTLDPAGVLTEADVIGTFATDVATVDNVYTYGPQHIAVPAASTVVPLTRLDQGLHLAHMNTDAKKIATTAAKAHTIAAIRATAAKLARAQNHHYALKVFTTHPVAHGVRITATNPYTHTHTTWTVTAKGHHTTTHHVENLGGFRFVSPGDGGRSGGRGRVH